MLNRVEIRRLTWPLQNNPLLYLQKILGCFCYMFWVHLYYEAPPHQHCSIWLNLGRISEFFRQLLSSVTSSINSNPVPLEAMHALAITLLHHVSQMYALDHELFQAFFILFLSVNLVQVDLKFNRLIWPCLHLVLNPLYLLW